MNTKRIAHISDLHVGSENRGLDMCPHELSASERLGRNEDYVGTLVKLVSSPEFENDGPIDMLCITGDISNRAHTAEFESADKAIQRIARALKIPNEAIYYVPGNHDVHWPVMTLSPKEFWTDYRYAPLLKDGLTFRKRALMSSIGAFEKFPFFLSWESQGALVVGVNSAAFDGPESDNHPGEVRQETVDELKNYLLTQPIKPGQIRICMLHHHLFQYSEPIPNAVDSTIAVNSENLLKVLSDHSFDLVMHGHKHQPRLKTHFENNGHPYVSMCAGSFSAVLHPLYFDGCSNLFHVVNVNGRDIDSGGIHGTVQSWTHRTVGKWEPSHKNRGIPAFEAFGSHATPVRIRANIKAAVEQQMLSGGPCRWEQILLLSPLLKNVRTEVSYKYLLEVTNELGFDMVGEMYGSTVNWVVFGRTL